MEHPNGYGPSAGITITFRFTPGVRATHARVLMTSGLNRTYKREDLWEGLIPVKLEDLHGRTRREVALKLADGLHSYWEGLVTDELAPSEPAEGAGAPLGATGGTVGQDPLPGL